MIHSELLQSDLRKDFQINFRTNSLHLMNKKCSCILDIGRF